MHLLEREKNQTGPGENGKTDEDISVMNKSYD